MPPDLFVQDLTTPSKRLKYLRSLLKVSRSYLQEKFNLPEVTLKSWENGTGNITSAAVKRCVEIYRAEGIIVSEEWILQGVGLDPSISLNVHEYLSKPLNEDFSQDDEILMFRDVALFKESHPGSVVLLVSNDDMRPFYRPGDYVGGRMRTGQDISSAINKDCIVQLKEGDRYFRRLIRNEKLLQYNLTCLNPNETTAEPVLYNAQIESVAPIIWHRRKDD